MKLRELMKLTMRSILTVLRHQKAWMVLIYAGAMLYSGAAVGLTAPLLQRFLDEVSAAANSTTGFLQVLLFGLLYAFTELSQWIALYLKNITYQIMFRKGISLGLTETMNLKTGRLEPIAFDDPKTLDIINRAAYSVRGLATLYELTLTFLLGRLLPLTIIVVYLASVHPLLCLIPLLVTLPIMFTQLSGVGAYTQYEKNAAPLRREAEAYLNYAGSRESAKETRIYGAVEYFRNLYCNVVQAMSQEMGKADRKAALLVLLSSIISLAGFGIALFLMVRLTVEGIISITAFAAVFTSLNRIFTIVEGMVVYDFARVTRNAPNAQAFFDFMTLPERQGSAEMPELSGGIRVENISFRYPGREQDAVNNVSLEIHSGETVAIVGENGSGKSTLVKLLLGLYLPQTGSITYGGHPVTEYAADALVQSSSAVFQDFQKYKLSLKDNVVISDLARAEKECGFSDSPERVTRISSEDATSLETTEMLIHLGVNAIDSEHFPDGTDTILAKEFGGIDLSGGQWQKTAIARGLYRSHSLIALDEPTAAIDPIEETRLYKQFAEICADKTAIIVTHRLGSARIADRIVVMKNGCIEAVGTHDELVLQGGEYAQMWEAQSGWYQTT